MRRWLGARPHDAAGATLEPLTRYLRRRLILPGGKRIEIDDDRPHLAAQEIKFTLPRAACDGAADYELRHERVGFIEGDDEANASIESSFVVKNGSLPGR